MNNNKFRIMMIGLIIAGMYAACRKTDQTLPRAEIQNPADRFFNSHASADPYIQSLTAYAKRENEKYGFVKNISSKIGYPQWDKAMVLSGKAAAGRTGTDSVNITYIPFVRDSQHYVNATMAIATVPGDTTVRILCDWQYKDTAATGIAKNKFALTMMNLDRAVFGNRLYKLTDTSIFSHRSRYVKLGAPSDNRFAFPGGSSLLEWVYSYTICWSEYVPINNGQMTGCPPGPDCPFYTEVQSCIEITWSSGTGSGGTGTGGGTGGGTGTGSGSSGSGGGWVPPTNTTPCGGGVATRTDVQYGCGVGWVPAGGGGNSPAESIDSMLARYSRTMNHMTDSIFTLSMALNKEWGHILVKNTSDSIYPKNPKTDNLATSVKQNRTTAPGERIIAEVHIHPDTSSNPLDRDGPSGDDLWALKSNMRDRYTLFVDVGDQKFALVIENIDSANAFFNSRSLAQIQMLHDSIPLTITTPSWVSNWRNATRQSLIRILGSSSHSGIGFYISSNTEKTLYIKLNP